MTPSATRTIVFITGTFLGTNCWDEWKRYFEGEGYTCLVPAWPHKDAPPEVLRNRHPDANIALNTLADLTDYFAAIVDSLPERPILIGHSLGGLIVQLLLQRDVAVAGVAAHSFPPQGVNTFRFFFMKAIWKSMGLFTSADTSYMMSFTRWRFLIANQMSWDQQKELFYRYATPESKLIMRDMFRFRTPIDFTSTHAPLLFISGGDDLITPAWLNRINYKQYKNEYSITDYKEFRNHNHLVFDQCAWESEAAFVHNWIEELKYISPTY